jgi:hypothetical protein
MVYIHTCTDYIEQVPLQQQQQLGLVNSEREAFLGK